MQTILEMFGPRRQPDGVGVELEVEGVNLPREVAGWVPKADGSLRGEALEYVSAGACSLKILADRMDALQAAFIALNGKSNNSYRASTHVHVNVQNLTAHQIVGILTLWTCVESLWMRLCGPTRENNLFCASSASQGDIPEYCRELLKMEREKAYHRPPFRYKYTALNTNRLSDLGTVEFRTFPSSIEKEEVVRWAGWSYNLTKFGSEIDLDNLQFFFDNLRQFPLAILQTIFDKKTMEGLTTEFVTPFIDAGIEEADEIALVWAEHKAKLLKPQPKKVPEPGLVWKKRRDPLVVLDDLNINNNLNNVGRLDQPFRIGDLQWNFHRNIWENINP